MKYSKQRHLILEIVKGTDQHPTAATVYEKAKEMMPGIGIATVYRNLNALTENGDLLKINNVVGDDRYDANTSDHLHLQCTSCGKVFDLFPKDEEMFNDLKLKLLEVYNIKDSNVSIGRTVLRGCCNACLEHKQKTN